MATSEPIPSNSRNSSTASKLTGSIIDVLGRVRQSVASALAFSSDLSAGGQYSKLPLTRTSSSGISHDLERYAAVEDDTFLERAKELWQSQRTLIVSTAASTSIFVLLLVAVLRGSATNDAYSYALASSSALGEINCRFDPSILGEDAGWYAHPTSYAREQQQRLPSEKPLRPLQSQRRMSQECADMWIAQGELCPDIAEGRLSLGDSEVDVVWTFVEPTEHWQKWEQAYKAEMLGEEAHGTGAKHFRSYDEIRYSIRSVNKNLPFARKQTLLATSLPMTLPPANATELADLPLAACRVAQLPEWMDAASVTLLPGGAPVEKSKMEVLSHWQLFDTQEVDLEQSRQRKQDILPTFNSHSIESQLYNLPQPAETLLYLNNDVYIGRKLGASDLSTPLFGPVFRVYPGSFATGAQSLEEVMAIDGEGNARVMPNTIRLLDERFGRRARNYPDHTGHVLSSSIMDEVARTWSAELNETAAVRFRGRGSEVWLPLLNLYYIVEKHREALLWSFIVARCDLDSDGSYSPTEREAMFAALGGNVEGDTLTFAAPIRPVSSEDHIASLQAANVSAPLETHFMWPSANGYPYVSSEDGDHLYPNYDGVNERFCSVSISECFGTARFFTAESGEEEEDQPIPTPEDLLKRVAFEQPRCGDCLMAGLLRASGERGFEAFLPPKSKQEGRSSVSSRRWWPFSARDVDNQETVPELGQFRQNWQEADLSLKAALASPSLQHTAGTASSSQWSSKRDFAVRLIQRYSYSFGDTPSSFNEMGDDVGWDTWLAWRMGEDSNPFIAINDHVTSSNATIQDGVRKVMHDWQEMMFPDPSPYELRATLDPVSPEAEPAPASASNDTIPH